MASLLPNGKQQYFNNSGVPLSGGKIYTYAAGAGMTTPKATYSDAAGLTPNSNPVILDARGEALIFWDGIYDISVHDASDALIYTVQNVGTNTSASSVQYGAENLGGLLKSNIGKVVPTISALRAIDKTQYTQANVTGYFAAGDGGGGVYCYDSADTTTADNGGTVIVASDGGRWKLATQSTISVKQFGAKGDGATDDNAAIQAAINALGSSGGTIYFPPGIYVCASGLTMDGKYGVVLRGEGGTTAGGVSASSIKFTLTGAGDALSMRSTVGCQLRHLMIYYSSSSFTGNLINADAVTTDTAFLLMDSCTLGNNALTSANRLVTMDKCIEMTFRACNFYGASYQVTGQKTGTYCNVVKFRDCQFRGYLNYATANGGQAWSFDGCTFEQGAGNQPGAFTNSAPVPCVGLSFRGCWFGDASVAGTWINLTTSSAFQFEGNYMSGYSGIAITGISLTSVNGVDIKANGLQIMNPAINFAGACEGVRVASNRFESCVTTVSNIANATNASFDENSPTIAEQTLAANGKKKLADGLLLQWGTATTTGGSAPVTFPQAFSTTPYSVSLGMTSPPGTATSVWFSNATSTGMTVNITSGAAVVQWHAIGPGE